MKSAAAAFAFFLILAPVAQAQEATPETEHGRFTFKQVPDGLLRLDSRTGEVALCSKRAVGWACQALPDGIKGPPATAKPDQDLKLPSDADLDRAMSFLERAWRRLLEMVQNFQREMENEKGKKHLEKGGPDKKS